ncbi:hypothetical protein IWW45_002884, partial [Coemansia sp. RSA 485]
NTANTQQQSSATAHGSAPPASAAAAAAAAAASASASGSAAVGSNNAANATSQSPARESTRRLSSVVWGPTGFERLDTGMSRCKICGKEYSRGSSTGTLKRHFKQHHVNLSLTSPYTRNSPPNQTQGSRPRAYSHRVDMRTRRETSPSPFAATPSAHSQHQQSYQQPQGAGVSALAMQQQQQQQHQSQIRSQMQQRQYHPQHPLQQQQHLRQSQIQRQSSPGDEKHGSQQSMITPDTSGSSTAMATLFSRNSGSVPADIDSSSVIAGSALLSMAAGGDSRMAVDGEPVRRAGRLSDPSVYQSHVNSRSSIAAMDDEACDIQVSPTPSTSSISLHSSHVLRSDPNENGGLLSGIGMGNGRRAGSVEHMLQSRHRVTLPPLRHVSNYDDMDIEDVDGSSILPPLRKRARRATVAEVQTLAPMQGGNRSIGGSISGVDGFPAELGAEIDALLPSQLVALSSELVRRVANVLPVLAMEAADTALSGQQEADPIDMLVGHIKRTLLDKVPNGSAALPEREAAGSDKEKQPRTFSSSLLSFLSSPHSASATFSSCALPFTIRKQVPLSQQANQPIASTSFSTMLSRVSAAMQRIAPLSLAELKWDNVGILLEAAKPREKASKVFLTIDLTADTLDEALDDPGVGVIVAYHPPIFTAWKSLSMSNLKQSLVLKCAAAGVSIYSPHTSLDSCANGINDWLASLVGEGKVTPITPADPVAAAGQENAGTGRLVELATPRPLSEIVADVKSRLSLEHIRVARAARHMQDKELISRIAICAGSGESVVGPVSADLYLTGEMGHHDVLAAVAKNTSCILGEHSNTERGYLHEVLKARLQEEFDGDSHDDAVSIVVSQNDRDPIVIE